MPTDKTSAIVVLSSTQIVPKVQFEKLKTATLEQLDLIERTQREIPLRAIVAGIALHFIKSGVKHGEFGPWIKAHATKSHKQCGFYMRLAQVALDKVGAEKSELASLHDGATFALTTSDAAGRKFIQRLEKFIDGKTLNELLDENNIRAAGKKIGGARTAGAGQAADKIDPEQLVDQAREEISAAHAHLRQLLIEENICARLPADDIRAADASFTATLTEWRKSVSKLLNKKS